MYYRVALGSIPQASPKISHGAIQLNTDPVSLPPHNGQSGNHKIPLDTLWSLHEVVLPIASTLYIYT